MSLDFNVLTCHLSDANVISPQLLFGEPSKHANHCFPVIR